MLLAEPLKTEKNDKTIRIWIMVKVFMICYNIVYGLTLIQNCSDRLICSTYISYRFCTSVRQFMRDIWDCRPPFPSPWCGLWVAVVTQRAGRSLVSSSGIRWLEGRQIIQSLKLWANGSAQWTRKAWCTTISTRYHWLTSARNFCLLNRYFRITLLQSNLTSCSV